VRGDGRTRPAYPDQRIRTYDARTKASLGRRRTPAYGPPARPRRRQSVTPATSNRLPAAAVRTLDAYVETVLACSPRVARRGGVHIVSTAQRGLPSWHG